MLMRDDRNGAGEPHFRHLRRRASDGLRTTVADCWVLQAARCRAVVEAALPDAAVELYFNLGPHGREVFRPGFAAPAPRAAWVVGPRANTLLVAKEIRDCDVVGVRLNAGAAAQVFGVPARELTGQLIDLDLLWGPVVSEIRERLHATSDLRARLELAEQVIQQRLTRFARSGVTWNQELLRALGSSDRPVAEQAQSCGLTHRQLIEFFDQYVGLKPKQYQRVQRLRRVLQAIHAPDRAAWAELAVRCGYFDQAHLIHDFHKLTGLTPTSYQQKRTSVGQGFVPHLLAV